VSGPPFDNFSEYDDDATPLLGGHQGSMKRSTPLGELVHQKGMKPSKLLDLSLPRSATDLGELPFQKGRPLDSSDKEEGQTTRRTKDFALERGVFMVRIVEIQHSDDECLEHVQFDDYRIDDDNNYISDMPVQNTDTMMSFDSRELPEHALDATYTMKIEDEDDVQKEHCRLRNAKRAKRRQCMLEQHQPDNLYDFFTTNLRNIINVGRDSRNVIITKHKNVSKWRPTAPPTTTFLKTI
jgi:hypothetical protein